MNTIEEMLKEIPPDALGYHIHGKHLQVKLTKEEQEEWVRSKGEFKLTIQQVLERGVEINDTV